ncbi:MAG: LysM peptidoglycan-binding domain-containing protein [Candidatus Cryptobacteroides sp.]
MTRKKSILLTGIIVLIMSAPYMVQAQEFVAAPVEVSKERVKRDGKLYYAHRVLQKQTLYSISKAYGVTLADIYEANPSITGSDLKADTIILIPLIEKSEADSVAQTEKEGSHAEGINPQEKKASKEKKKSKEDGFRKHKVKWYEDLDVISEKYGVPVDVIMKVNNLTGRKLAKRQVLLIPEDPSMWTEESSDETDVNEDALSIEEKEVKEESVHSGNQGDQIAENTDTNSSDEVKDEGYGSDGKDGKVKAVILLPANVDSGIERRSDSSLDFYSGALLAARNLGNGGYDVEIEVFDMPGKELPVEAWQLAKADVVIGPFRADALQAVLNNVDEETYVVSPLDHKADSLAWKYPNFIQAPSSVTSQYEDLARWIASENRPGDRTVIIYETGSRDYPTVSMLSKFLAERDVVTSQFSYGILEGREVQAALAERMSTENANRVLVVSEGEAFVNDVVRNLNLMIHNKYDVTLFCPSKIRGFETIDTDNLHNTKLHVSSSYDIDYDNAEVMKFVMEYRALYNTEPTPFAFQGYDVTSYFIGLCAKYGKSWPRMLDNAEAEKLQSGFAFARRDGKGWSNTGIRRIVFGDNYSVERVK